ncbi:hypothetical protein BIW11_07227 [Tropilaelaps mercedesae]|uniref:Small ribosomal subunit protein mS23 n=1 Tax=Tropilaelaps mercedesae TaxID=418985 RepID=A0A1V9XUS2_9ACAR|nr:hypothetical protein BIW11_07227 [Tropilaelaps mercedesae]
MAGSRVYKLGTVFSRTNGLLRAGGLKWEDRPIWYDVYEAYPPEIEPTFLRPAPPAEPIREILYKEDAIRARFAKEVDKNAHPEPFMRLYTAALNEQSSELDAFSLASERFKATQKTERKSVRTRPVGRYKAGHRFESTPAAEDQHET